MNRFEARIEAIRCHEKVCRIDCLAGKTPVAVVTLSEALTLRTGQRVTLGVKATQLTPLPRPCDAFDNQIAGTVAAVDEGTVLSVLEAATPHGRMEAVLPTETLKALGLTIGQSVYLGFHATDTAITEW